jgi:hypothetical protein
MCEDSSDYTLSESIWVVRQKAGFTAKYRAIKYDHNAWAILMAREPVDLERPVIDEYADTSKTMSAKDEQTINSYMMLAIEAERGSRTDSNVKSRQGYQLDLKGQVIIGVSNDLSREAFNNAKRSIFHIVSSNFYRTLCEKPKIESLVFKRDTTYDYPNLKKYTIRSFDLEKRLRQIFISHSFDSDSGPTEVSSTTIYDTAGHIVYEDKREGFARLHCNNYRYDATGRLLFKEGFSSNELGVKQTYIYEGDKLIKLATERITGKTEKVF